LGRKARKNGSGIDFAKGISCGVDCLVESRSVLGVVALQASIWSTLSDRARMSIVGFSPSNVGYSSSNAQCQLRGALTLLAKLHRSLVAWDPRHCRLDGTRCRERVDLMWHRDFLPARELGGVSLVIVVARAQLRFLSARQIVSVFLCQRKRVHRLSEW
jgi:hypothetical protein